MLIPQPHHFSATAEAFPLNADTRICGPATLVRELLAPTGLPLAAASSPGPGVISLLVDPTLGPEAYRLTVTADQVDAVAGGAAGLAWAVQTMRQLMPIEVYGKEPRPDRPWTIAGAHIRDEPRYAWRGLLLDVARWYQPVEWLRTVVDLLAMHRMNILHLHLTDDQGWRFQVHRYPRLTSAGAYRRESPLGHASGARGDGTPHGGFYTQDDLRGLVTYALRRGVTIVPEIDLPGHTQAAIAAYPQLGAGPSAPEVWTRFGISDQFLNTAPETVAFFTAVLDELVDVFPSPYVHIGGDEVPAPGLVDFWMPRLAGHLTARGRRPVIWDEPGSTPPAGSLVMVWHDAARVASAGPAVIAAPHTHTYLNYPAAAGPSEPLSIGSDGSHGPLSLEMVHAYDPGPVTGVQANLWTEYAPTPARAEYDLMPRLAALAEVAWGRPAGTTALQDRLPHHLRRLDAAGIGYRPLHHP
jgi:hexosaminidase